jgi:hypothetical protein
VLAALLVAGCGSPASEGTSDSVCGPAPASFIALERDFQDFDRWPAIDLGLKAANIADVHNSGHRIAYLGCLPPPGSASFPVGMKIVKVGEADNPPNERQIFAMVKRGGGYNEGGAQGWEWFELKQSNLGPVVLVWRGTGPPAGENYTDQGTTCNDCHAASKGNDYVPSPLLDLAALGARASP